MPEALAKHNATRVGVVKHGAREHKRAVENPAAANR